MPQVYTRFPDEWNAALMARVYGGPLILPWWIQAGIFGFDGDVQLGSGASVIAARPGLDQTVDLGTSSKNFRDAWVGNDINKEAGTSGVYAKCGGPIYKSVTDVTTSGTTETDLWNQSLAANVLAVNNETLHFVFGGEMTASAFTYRLKVYFPTGTAIFDSGAQAQASDSDWLLEGWITRVSSTTARCITKLSTGLNTLFTFCQYAALSTQDFTIANVLRVTGTMGATGGTQIAFRMGKIYHEAAV
jgi:hypothetical protein